MFGGIKGKAEEVDGFGLGAIGHGIVTGMDLRERFLRGAAIGLEFEEVNMAKTRGGHDIDAATGLGGLWHNAESTGGEKRGKQTLLVGLVDLVLT